MAATRKPPHDARRLGLRRSPRAQDRPIDETVRVAVVAVVVVRMLVKEGEFLGEQIAWGT